MGPSRSALASPRPVAGLLGRAVLAMLALGGIASGRQADPAVPDPATLAPADALALFMRWHEQGEHLKALALLRGVLAALEGTARQEPRPLALFHYHAADVHRVLRQFEAAFESLRASERWREAMLGGLDAADPRHQEPWSWAENMRCRTLGLRGWIHQDLGHLDRARALFLEEQAEIEALHEAGVDVRGTRLDAYKHWANLAMLTGSPEEIDALLEQRAAHLSPPFAAYLRLRRAGAWHKRARREGAGNASVYTAFEAALADPALEPLDRIHGELWLADFELEESRRARARELWTSAGERLEALGAQGTRARRTWVGVGAILADTPAEQAAWRARLAAEIEAVLAEWGALDPREGGYGLLHLGETRRLFSEYTRLARAVEGEEVGTRTALECLARAHAETTLARRLGAEAPGLEALRAALCPRAGQGLLAYLAGPSASWVFALDSSTLRALPLASDRTLEGARSRLVSALLASDGSWTEAVRGAARELATELLPDGLGPWLEGVDSLAVCGLDLFAGDVPFELLDLGEDRILGAEKAVWNLPSLAAGVVLARAEAGATAPGLRLLAAPVLRPALASALGLAEFQLEARQLELLVASFAPESRQVFLGPDAHAGALEGPPPPILQFLVHGAYDESRSPGSELVLAAREVTDDGLLSARDVERLLSSGATPRLAILTACRAGRGAERRGDFGATGLAGAFLASGTRAVVASPYDLELGLACALSAACHAALVGGADPAEALRQARADLARDERFASSVEPYLLRAIGFAPALFPGRAADARTPRSLVATASALALVLAGLLVLRSARRR